MRAYLPVTLLLGLSCSQHLAYEIPYGDGYGPAGGVRSGDPGASASSAPTSEPTSPPAGSQPPATDDAGATAGEAGATPTRDAGASDARGDAASDASDASHPSDAGSITALLSECAGSVNSFRSQNGVTPLTESATLESYAALAAASDAQSGQRHGYFYSTNGGGVAATEDELDGDQVDPGGSAEQTLLLGLQQDEQAQGAAAANLLDDQFSEVGCGFGQDATGNWWIVIALR